MIPTHITDEAIQDEMDYYEGTFEKLPPRSADAILTAPPSVTDTQSEVFSSTAITLSGGELIDEAKDVLEQSMVRALLRIMNSTTAREADVIKAVGESAELLGKKGKSQVNIIHSENAQINQILEKPELMGHIKAAAAGIKQVSGASDANIKTHKGGKGD